MSQNYKNTLADVNAKIKKFNLHHTLTDMLFDSVAPLVNTISFGSAPIRSATCYKKEIGLHVYCVNMKYGYHIYK